ncbi:formate--tetrahydrofolate ligase [Spiroplasma endosymbiont of Aspidapion aeneum]|uniref:formate--tetrahydrofolate ligase n=1 Tax=Spiroplasma endosymbiont of Aspidapion aeneum TaxID=3066276 RepID=UPI00313AD2E4
MIDLLNLINKWKIDKNNLIPYGQSFKLKHQSYVNNGKKGKLILTTSINPTKSGEGKTTVSIGIGDALTNLGKKAMLALREPSIGPVFGQKGTATGGGESRLEPYDDINLHFNGDMYAIEMANNLISSIIDNHIYWKTDLDINHNLVTWKRTSNLNDRSLRKVDIKISKFITRCEEFVITPACDIMNIMTICEDINDFKNKLENSTIGFNNQGNELFVKDLKITGSILSILKDAFNPNIVKSAYNTLSLIHCGPFANISVGTNSIISTKIALSLSDYTITECGFGSDLGFEKYMNLINFNKQNLIPDCVVLVVTIKALLEHNDFENNFKFLKRHIQNIKQFNLNMIVAINKFSGFKDKEEELEEWLVNNNIDYEYCSAYTDGPIGATKLSKKIIKLCDNKVDIKTVVSKDNSIEEKIALISKNFYDIDEIIYSDISQKKLLEFAKKKDQNFLPICIVKSPTTLSGNNENKIVINDIIINKGAGFVLVYLNNIFSMPGLNKNPNAEKIMFNMKNYKIENLD